MADAISTFAAIAAAGIAFAMAALLWRSERARGGALANLARAEERVRAADALHSELTSMRASAAELERRNAALCADLENARQRIAALHDDVAQGVAEQRRLRDERDGLGRTLERERAEARALERQIADLKEAKEEMRQAFAAHASELMQAHSETFKAQNREQIDHLLKPLKNDIDSFRNTLTDAYRVNAEQHGALKEQIERLSTQSASVSKEAENLARALKGDVQLQGAWGEMIVDTILQRLGLREGVEYTRQESFSDSEGRARTDYVINLPNGERLIVDSKVSLRDFEAAANAGDEVARSARISAHARSMRTHVRTLASKEYHARIGTRLDYVVMFVPIEAALGAALTADETLTLDALDLKVAIATPTTLTTVMMTVASMWKIERQHRNAEDIAARAGKLYDKFAGFVADLEKIGERLDQAQSSYSEALAKLKGSGGLVRQAEMLKSLGARSAKSLPPHLLSAAEDDPTVNIVRIGEADPERATSAAAEAT
jgi:DNA recombination protein RmuC